MSSNAVNEAEKIRAHAFECNECPKGEHCRLVIYTSRTKIESSLACPFFLQAEWREL